MDILHVQNVVSALVLLILSVQDIIKKEISAIIVAVYLLAGIFVGMVNNPIDDFVLSLLPGIAFGMLYFIAGKGMGIGDVLVVSALGIWLGLQNSLVLVTVGVAFLEIYVMASMLIMKIKTKRVDMESEIPFIPFLLIGLVVRMVNA